MDILDFVSLHQLKNGTHLLKFTLENKANIYQKLFDLGYRRSRINLKRFIFFKQRAMELSPVDISDMRRAFLDFMQELDDSAFPSGISKNVILNYYLKKMPVRANGLLFHHLHYELSENEAHHLLMYLDFEYRHKFEIEQLHQQLCNWGFIQTIDTGSFIATNKPLYYKNIGEGQYLVFSQQIPKFGDSKHDIDCWIATFNNSSEVGNIEPIHIDEIMLSFQLDRDFPLISKYII
jgi:hypothetical protein